MAVARGSDPGGPSWFGISRRPPCRYRPGRIPAIRSHASHASRASLSALFRDGRLHGGSWLGERGAHVFAVKASHVCSLGESFGGRSSYAAIQPMPTRLWPGPLSKNIPLSCRSPSSLRDQARPCSVSTPGSWRRSGAATICRSKSSARPPDRPPVCGLLPADGVCGFAAPASGCAR